MLMLTPTKEIRLGDYQFESVEALREGIRQGRKRQVLVAPTGAGKSRRRSETESMPTIKLPWMISRR